MNYNHATSQWRLFDLVFPLLLYKLNLSGIITFLQVAGQEPCKEQFLLLSPPHPSDYSVAGPGTSGGLQAEYSRGYRISLYLAVEGHEEVPDPDPEDSGVEAQEPGEPDLPEAGGRHVGGGEEEVRQGVGGEEEDGRPEEGREAGPGPGVMRDVVEGRRVPGRSMVTQQVAIHSVASDGFSLGKLLHYPGVDEDVMSD